MPQGRKSERDMSSTAFLSCVDAYAMIMETLSKLDSEINDDYDLWNAARQLKTPHLNFLSAYKKRVFIALADYSIIPDDESQATTANLCKHFKKR